MKEEILIKVVNKSANKLPEYKTSGAAGMDVCSNDDNFVLCANKRALVHTGIYLQIPSDYEAQVRPRSGLAIKNGITVLNSPGTIDSDYRGEVCVILYNSSEQAFEVKKGERIAQLVFAKVAQAKLYSTESLDDTERGEGGFGHTGNK